MIERTVATTITPQYFKMTLFMILSIAAITIAVAVSAIPLTVSKKRTS